MFRDLNLRQIILDGLSILLCVAAVAAVCVLYSRLPDRIAQNFNAKGEVTRYGDKSVVFLLLGVTVLMTGSFSAILRIPAVYRNMNVPWTIPWGKEPLIVSVCKDMICGINLCCTLGNVYLVCATLRERLLQWLLWLPYAASVAVIVLCLVRMRKICKG